MADKDALIQPDRGQKATDIHLVDKAGFEAWLKGLSAPQRAALEAQKFTAGGYQTAIVPDGASDSPGWFAAGGVADTASLSSWCMAKLADALPAGTYRLAKGEPGPALHGWQTAQYSFDRYRQEKDENGDRILLTGPGESDRSGAGRSARSVHGARSGQHPGRGHGPGRA